MAFLKLSDDLKSHLGSCLKNFRSATDAFNFLQSDPSNFIPTIRKMLKNDLFVHVNNVAFTPNRIILEAIARCLGEFRNPVENTQVRLECDHDGCSLGYLPLHNDDAMLLDKQPKFGVLQVEEEDPLKLPKNGIVKIDEVIDYLQLYNPELLDDLLNIKVPMLFGKYHKITKNDKIIFIQEEGEIHLNLPILYIENGIYLSRFHIGHINYFYYKKRVQQTEKEKRMIASFLQVANKFRKEFYLKQNDLLFFNNKRTLHDRTECSIELNLNGRLQTRKFYIAFAL